MKQAKDYKECKTILNKKEIKQMEKNLKEAEEKLIAMEVKMLSEVDKCSDELQKTAITLDTLVPVDADEIIEYIENTERRIDAEWYGDNRSLEELIKDKVMPELYNKLLALRNGEESNPSPVSETQNTQFIKFIVAGGDKTQISEMKIARKLLIHHFPNLFIEEICSLFKFPK